MTSKRIAARLDRLEQRARRQTPAPRYDLRWPDELTTDASGQTIVKATGERWQPDIVLHWPPAPDLTDSD